MMTSWGDHPQIRLRELALILSLDLLLNIQYVLTSEPSNIDSSFYMRSTPFKCAFGYFSAGEYILINGY